MLSMNNTRCGTNLAGSESTMHFEDAEDCKCKRINFVLSYVAVETVSHQHVAIAQVRMALMAAHIQRSAPLHSTRT
jgi:hypothetical protein